jgi:hypothetical protein
MTLNELMTMTRVYARDNNSYMFKDSVIKMFINQAIDRIRQYPIFASMPYLSGADDAVTVLPSQYHYLLALFASARCYDTDERFYEGTEKRNEFEFYLDNLIADVENGNILILDGSGNVLDNPYTVIDYVTDTYFARDTSESDDGVDSLE